jgi:hypothetical protein
MLDQSLLALTAGEAVAGFAGVDGGDVEGADVEGQAWAVNDDLAAAAMPEPAMMPALDALDAMPPMQDQAAPMPAQAMAMDMGNADANMAAPMPAQAMPMPHMQRQRMPERRWGPMPGAGENMHAKIAPAVEVARVFAYQGSQQALRAKQPRRDFTSTVYWAGAVSTDESGVAVVRFHVSDSVTTFRAMADAVTRAGVLGIGSAVVVSQTPSFVEMKVCARR